MRPDLYKAVVTNDKKTFLSLVHHSNQLCLKQVTSESKNSVLHLAAKFGHYDLVSEIVKLSPELVEAKSSMKETPLHEASRCGHDKIVMLLFQTNPLGACLINKHNQSPMYLACSNGHLNVVKLFLNQSWVLDFEEDGNNLSSLLVSVSQGHSEIVKRLLKLRPNLAHKADNYGSFPLHRACSIMHLEIARIILQTDPDLAKQHDANGYTPLHMVAIKGDVKILQEFMIFAPSSFHFLSKQGNTIFHLCVRNRRFDAFVFSAQVFNDKSLIHCPDQFGNTVLHIAVSLGLSNFVDYIISKTTVDVNYGNQRGHTALDIIIEQARNTSESLRIKEMLQKAGGRKSTELDMHLLRNEPFVNEYELNVECELNRQPLELLPATSSSHHEIEDIVAEDELNKQTLEHLLSAWSSQDIVDHCVAETENENPFELHESSGTNKSPTSLHQLKIQSQRHMKDLGELYRTQKRKQYKIYIEALQNARNTIILVAILISTVTFTACLSPPGGVYQEGPLKGQSTVGRTTAFKIFTISNTIALFTSLCLVIVLVSIIPFERKLLGRLIVVAHKVMWVAVSFMATAFVAATWVILPHGHGDDWTFEAILAISAGSMGAVFLNLGAVLTRHWVRKLKWRRQRFHSKIDENGDHKINENGENKEYPELCRSQSSNSDVDSASSTGRGYHLY